MKTPCTLFVAFLKQAVYICVWYFIPSCVIYFLFLLSSFILSFVSFFFYLFFCFLFSFFSPPEHSILCLPLPQAPPCRGPGFSSAPAHLPLSVIPQVLKGPIATLAWPHHELAVSAHWGSLCHSVTRCCCRLVGSPTFCLTLLTFHKHVFYLWQFELHHSANSVFVHDTQHVFTFLLCLAVINHDWF